MANPILFGGQSSVQPTLPSSWLLLQSGPGDSALNMAMDEAILEAMPRLRQPILRFYGWTDKAGSFGYFQRYAAVERMTLLRPLVRRPTAGGLVPHDADWTYCLAFPTSHPWYAVSAIESYRRVHTWLQAAFAKLKVATELAPSARTAEGGQCFVGHEKLDLLWREKKIAGAAQRRRRDGLLIQGSIQPAPLSLAKADWQKALCDVAHFEQAIRWLEFTPDTALHDRAAELARQKYSQPSYNRKR